MGQRKKTGKDRLDKYYHLAKTQGYRARSAFKLIQLNKKYGFLEKAHVLIDLCAAPGGWLQVAAKYMPVNSLIIGVDLAAIKPIPRVITHVEDITSESCRSTLRKDMKDWKADVVLHDGAPNVGTAWVQDAYAQSELVLHSLKLATEFLAPQGTFVTKVFRSKNYNQLLFVFNQLFDKVEATKPPSSRNVSAEIFVVCRGFKSPKKIDSKFLDPRHVFDEVEDLNADGTMTAGNALNTILYPEKASKKRHREGYADGDYTLHKAVNVVDFVRAPSEAKAIEILASCHQILWKCGELGEDVDLLEKIENHPLTTEEVRICFNDLKVLGRKDYKGLLKWRKSLKESLFKKETSTVPKKKEELVEIEEMEIDPLEELEKMAAEVDTAEKKARKKRLKKLAKEREKMRLQMITPTDIGLEEGGIDEVGFGDAKKADVVANGQMDDDHALLECSDDEKVYLASEYDEESDLEEGEDELKVGLEAEVNAAYEDYVDRKSSRDPKVYAKKLKRFEVDDGKEFTGCDQKSSEPEESDIDEVEMKSEKDSHDSDNDFVSSADEMEENFKHGAKTKMWFGQSLFNDIDLNEEVDDRALEKVEKMVEKPKKEDIKSKKEEVYDLENVLSTAEAITMAMEMVKDGGRLKNDLIDDLGYRRNVYHDQDGLPQWFLDDERKHNKPQRPVTKEAVQLLRERQKTLDARPIKKVLEAKARKKRKAQSKLDNIREKMNALVEDNADDVELGAKLKQVSTTMKRALTKAKAATRKEVKLVVARGSHKGVHGRPKGVKGKYKMVDRRMKKELRAEKRKAKTKRRK